MTCIAKLLEIASVALCEHSHSSNVPNHSVSLFAEYERMCARRNGFYAFESALHVYPLADRCSHVTFDQWNVAETWKSAYGGAADRPLFFAEDIFGEQFGFLDARVILFSTETAEMEIIANTLDEWACQLLVDFERLTGYPFAHEWQEKFGALEHGTRLAPKIPFMTGGEYDLSNFYSVDAAAALRFRGDFYRQTKDLPDGAAVNVGVKPSVP